MWFKSIYLKTLREYRVAILGWGLALGLMMVATLASFASIVTPETLATFSALGPTMRWYNEAIAITTPAGYTTWRMGPFLLTLAIWALLAGSRTLRGEEDQGRLDVLLSMPRSRTGVALEKLAALVTALMLMGLLIGLLTFIGGQRADAGFGLGAALLWGLNVALTASVFGALALLLAQLTRQRSTAAGLTGMLLALAFVLDSTARTADSVWLGYLSPIALYHRSKPLLAGYSVSWGGLAGLAGLALALSAAAVALFVRRDIGAPAVSFARRERAAQPRATQQGSWSLRSVFWRSLRVSLGSGRWWALGIALFAGWMTVLVKQLEDSLIAVLEQTEIYAQLINTLGGQQFSVITTMMNVYLIFFALALTMFVVTQVSRWAADEEEGRLDLVLATPQPRVKVIVGSFAAVALVLLGVALVLLGMMTLASTVAGFGLDQRRLTAAILSMVPLGLVVGAVGYLLSGWLRSAAVTGLLSALVLGSFFLSFVGPMLQWPEAVLQLSIFHHYGTPLLMGADWGAMLALLVLAGLALAGATYRFMIKDLAR